MDGSPEVLTSTADGVTTVILNRPHRRNAITGPMGDELAAAMAAVDPVTTGAVLLHGAEGTFCSGLDLKEYNADPPPPWLPTARQSLVAAHRALFDCPVPVVVALERFAINGGAAFALAGDLLVAGREAVLQIAEIRQGMAAPMNMAWLASRYPAGVAAQLVLTGRRFTGDDLHRLGIALDVVDDPDVLDHARNMAVELAAYPREGTVGIKAALRSVPGIDAGVFDRAQTDNPLTSQAPRAVGPDFGI